MPKLLLIFVKKTKFFMHSHMPKKNLMSQTEIVDYVCLLLIFKNVCVTS